MGRNFNKIVSTFSKTLKECEKHVAAMDRKAGKAQDKIYKLEQKREACRCEREQTYTFAAKLKDMLGVSE